MIWICGLALYQNLRRRICIVQEINVAKSRGGIEMRFVTRLTFLLADFKEYLGYLISVSKTFSLRTGESR